MSFMINMVFIIKCITIFFIGLSVDPVGLGIRISKKGILYFQNCIS